jgi:hypothetical protein
LTSTCQNHCAAVLAVLIQIVALHQSLCEGGSHPPASSRAPGSACRRQRFCLMRTHGQRVAPAAALTTNKHRQPSSPRSSGRSRHRAGRRSDSGGRAACGRNDQHMRQKTRSAGVGLTARVGSVFAHHPAVPRRARLRCRKPSPALLVKHRLQRLIAQPNRLPHPGRQA